MEKEKKIALSEYQEAKKELICWAARVAELETPCSQCGTDVSGETVHIMDMAAVELEAAREKQTAATIEAKAAMGRVVDLIQQAPTAGQRKVLLLRYIDGLGRYRRTGGENKNVGDQSSRCGITTHYTPDKGRRISVKKQGAATRAEKKPGDCSRFSVFGGV